MKDLCKFQVDIPINAKVAAVQSFENPHTFILRQPSWWARARPQPIFSNNITENSPNSFVWNSVFIGPNDLKFGTNLDPSQKDYIIQCMKFIANTGVFQVFFRNSRVVKTINLISKKSRSSLFWAWLFGFVI